MLLLPYHELKETLYEEISYLIVWLEVEGIRDLNLPVGLRYLRDLGKSITVVEGTEICSMHPNQARLLNRIM